MIKFPPPPRSSDTALVSYVQSLTKVLVDAFNKRPDVTEPRNTLLLVSPDGTVYSVGVNNSGGITSTKVS